MIPHGQSDENPLLRAFDAFQESVVLPGSQIAARPWWRANDPIHRWTVTMPTVTPDDRRGTHTFVVLSPTAVEALAAALREAGQDEAIRHRRNAAVDADAAVIKLWGR
ncbi:hypothetical protein [Streptomyces sp. MZ04]|uniref:hypothetical protein n=1 Tax=Streptomyces sp. MZ04 TaxID=2559236 RepID=UPI00107EE008|nr:hypothetical protein [Streptomyces sp. MZ04]TGB08252.1 hypothetical protein E2651_19780 [Streptomyces sp. MZ04]